jgi:predicted ATPase
VGRARDLAAIDDWLGSGARLVTLYGPGGIGKTRLALRYATARADTVTFVDLTEARTVDDALAATAAALGLALDGKDREPAAAAIGRALTARPGALVVFDNFEPVVGCAALLLDRWLQAAPDLRVLVTSREVLGLAGEVCYEVGPLEMDDAVELLCDRARLAAPDLRLDGSARAAAAAIVRELEGIPLAIELAAARAGALGLASLHRRLQQRLEVLRSDLRDRPDRHATMRAAIEWSWPSLTEHEQAALAECSIFRGGFTLEAAEAILTGSPGAPLVIELLASLRRKSLLRGCPMDGGESRFDLYETIREVAGEKLVAGSSSDLVLARHAVYYASLGEPRIAAADLPDALEGLDSVWEEQSNVVAAHRFSRKRDPGLAARLGVLLGRVFFHRGPIGRHLDVLDATVEDAERSGDLDLQARALLARGHARWFYGQTERGGGRDLLRAIELAEATGDRAAACDAGRILGAIELDRGHPAAARERLESALRLARDAGDAARLARVLDWLGRLAGREGDRTAARGCYEQAIELARSAGGRASRRLEAILLAGLALSDIDDGEPDEARGRIDAARAIFQELGDRRSLSKMLLIEGDLFGHEQAFDHARARYREALAAQHEAVDRKDEAILHGRLGRLALAEGRPEEALAAFERSADLCRQAGHAAMEAAARAYGAAARARMGRLPSAERAMAAARARLAGAAQDLETRAVVDVLESALDLARAGAENDAGHRDAARRRVAAAELEARPAGPSEQLRFAVALMRRMLDPAGVASAGPDAATLDVGRAGRWFRRPGGPIAELAHRHALRSILARLAEQRVTAAGTPLSVDELVRAGWPGARIEPQAGANRVYAAIRTLRRLGLRDVLLSNPKGYWLDGDVALRWPAPD